MDGTDIGSSDHLLVWMELGRASKTSKKRKRVIRRWRLDRFGDDEVKLSYQSALMAEVHEFSESTKSKIERGMKGQELVNEVVMEWENVVNRVAKCELGEKMIVCGRAARWWDEQIKDKINARRQLYKKVVNGREDLWGEYCRLRKEVKQLVIEKKLNIWNELVEKVNTDFDENKKEFWAFVGRKSKGKKKNIASLTLCTPAPPKWRTLILIICRRTPLKWCAHRVIIIIGYCARSLRACQLQLSNARSGYNYYKK